MPKHQPPPSLQVSSSCRPSRAGPRAWCRRWRVQADVGAGKSAAMLPALEAYSHWWVAGGGELMCGGAVLPVGIPTRIGHWGWGWGGVGDKAMHMHPTLGVAPRVVRVPKKCREHVPETSAETIQSRAPLRYFPSGIYTIADLGIAASQLSAFFLNSVHSSALDSPPVGRREHKRVACRSRTTTVRTIASPRLSAGCQGAIAHRTRATSASLR
jgi:hypothetical protein